MILGSSDDTGACSNVYFSDMSGFNLVFNAIGAIGGSIMIDSCTQLVIGSD